LNSLFMFFFFPPSLSFSGYDELVINAEDSAIAWLDKNCRIA
jgi:hypothetical protein